MKKQTRYWRYILYGIGLFLVLGVVLLLTKETVWVGHTDLSVEFVVTDAENGQPIDGAEVSVHAIEGWEDRVERKFHLRTPPDGIARDVSRRCMCSGRTGYYTSLDTWSVKMPSWRVSVVATGYRPCEPFLLREHPGRASAQRTAPGQSKVVIPVTLKKSRP